MFCLSGSFYEPFWNARNSLEDLQRGSHHNDSVHIVVNPGHTILTSAINADKPVMKLFSKVPAHIKAANIPQSVELHGTLVSMQVANLQGIDCCFLIFKSGEIQQWSYSCFAWSLKASIHLWSPGSSGTDFSHGVTTGLFSAKHSSLSWCQRRTRNGKVSSDIYSRPLRQGADGELTLGRMSLKVRDVPECRLYSVGDSLLIWPGEPSPPGIYLRWCQQMGTMAILHTDRGHVLTIGNDGGEFVFRDIVMKAVQVWNQGTSGQFRPIGSPHDNSLILLEPTSLRVVMVTEQGQPKTYKLHDGVIRRAGLDVSDMECCQCWNLLVLAVSHSMFIYSVRSGKLLQQLEVTDGAKVLKLCPSSGPELRILVVTTSGVLEIKLSCSTSARDAQLKRCLQLYKGIDDPSLTPDLLPLTQLMRDLGDEHHAMIEPYMEIYEELQQEKLALLDGNS